MHNRKQNFAIAKIHHISMLSPYFTLFIKTVNFSLILFHLHNPVDS